MAELEKDSSLYGELSTLYEKKAEKDITEAFFKECVELAKNYSRQEIHYALYKLKVLNEEIDTGLAPVDSAMNRLAKMLDLLMGKNVKKSFMIAVLETALEVI